MHYSTFYNVMPDGTVKQINPFTGKEMQSRELARVVSDNELVFEMYWKMGNDEFKVMEITYKRAEKKDKKDKK